jgi:2-keto-3-deoxy-L-fuconate dehydrogenase
MFSLKGKTAVVTGGASGIGKAISEIFARQGATVHILELNENAAMELANALNMEARHPAAGGTEGPLAYAHACDVANPASVKAVFDKIESLDILINNAGVAHIGNAETTTESDLDRIININIKGVYNCLQAAIPLLRKSGGGSIVNMASIAALVGLSDRFAYSMSKGAVYAMTLSVAKDYLKDNIRCNSISPARVHTPFVDGFLAKNYPDNQAEMFEKLSKSQPIGRMARPEEVAALALYLCSGEAGFITGTDYPIDGGFVKLNG